MSISWFSAPFLGYLVQQKLQGDEAVQLYILGLVDHTHPAAQLLDDAVVLDGLADYWALILRG
jgi:hypothetical protein